MSAALKVNQVTERTPQPARDWTSAEERAAWLWAVQPRNGDEQLAWLFARWRVDPIAYGVERFRVILTPYQAQAALDLADAPAEVYAFYGLDPSYPKRKVLLPSGHGLGKTRLEALLAWWHLETHAFSKTIITAPTSDQLSGQLWGELRKLNRRGKKAWPQLGDDWDVLSSTVTHKNPDYGDWCILGRTSREDRPEGLQGAHALDSDDEYGQLADIFGDDGSTVATGGILVITEESSGIKDAIREVLGGALSEDGARFLAAGNPTRTDGWFARDMDRPNHYAVHHLDCRMSNRDKQYTLPYRDTAGVVHHLKIRGFVRPAYWEELLDECDGDEDADRIRVRVRGLKPRSNFDQVIKSYWVESAQARPEDIESHRERAVLGLDFGLTSDKHGLAGRRGFNMILAEEWLPADNPEDITLQATRRAIDAQLAHNAGVIVGDANGVGRGAMEVLANYFHVEHPELKCRVVFFNSGAGALDSKRYYRRRDELWYKHGRAHIANPRCHLLNIPGLKRQLTAPGAHEDDARKIRVKSKAEIKKDSGEDSGNLADAYLQTLVVSVPHETEPKPESKPTIPAVFLAHFKRLAAARDAGMYIR